MAGVIGIVYKKENCMDDLKTGLHFLQHRAQSYCGLVSFNDNDFEHITHKGKVGEAFSEDDIKRLKGCYGIGSVANDRQPSSSISLIGEMALCLDGNLINYSNLKDNLIKEGGSFTGFLNSGGIQNINLLSKIISREINFERGIENMINKIEGDFAIVSLMKGAIYAARGWGRKPLILGQNEKGYIVSSESNSFLNVKPVFEIVRDVKPGEVVRLDKEGIHTIKEFNLQPIQYGTFEWIYTGYPNSIIDGKSVSEVRKNLGSLLAQKFSIKADLVSPVPNSGRWHAIGYAKESGIPYEEVFVRYDYSDRSFTPGTQEERDRIAKMKLIPVPSSIKGKKIILVDDSIVRGTQTLNQVDRLKEFGAEEVHIMVACPPLMCACKYGDTTKKDEDCIARQLEIEKIREKLDVNSLNYANISMLEKAIGIPKEKLCLTCWGD
jgi:amidophosphoribosyltransferase